jgi:DNA-binding XRE family transcriptional regulator
LREVRAEHLLSLRALAHSASVAVSTIHLIETGRVIPRPSVALKIARALAVDPHDVVEFRRTIEAIKGGRQGPHPPPVR